MAETAMGLPAGWEMKWDPVLKKPFFVNHADKTTTWDDPRLPKVQPADAAAAPVANANKGKSPAKGKAPTQKTANKSAVPSGSAAPGGGGGGGGGGGSAEPGGDHQVSDAVLQQLKDSYPSVPVDVLSQVWDSCKNDSEARVRLRHMGYLNRAEKMVEQTQKDDEQERVKTSQPLVEPKQPAGTANQSEVTGGESNVRGRERTPPVAVSRERTPPIAVSRDQTLPSTRFSTVNDGNAVGAITEVAKSSVEHATIAHGPNPALSRGPDTSLLVQGQSLARGPDPTLAAGPRHMTYKTIQYI